MSAIHLSSFGAPGSAAFTVVTQSMPVPQPGEVVVKMRLAPVNPADIFRCEKAGPHILFPLHHLTFHVSIMGVYPGFAPSSLPATPGLEGMGEIAALGDGVAGLSLGQRVVPFLMAATGTQAGHGSWQSYVVLPADHVFPVPENVADESAAQLIVVR